MRAARNTLPPKLRAVRFFTRQWSPTSAGSERKTHHKKSQLRRRPQARGVVRKLKPALSRGPVALCLYGSDGDRSLCDITWEMPPLD